MLGGSPELAQDLLRGTRISVGQLESDQLEFRISDMWQVSDNVTNRFGADWFLNFPVLWSVETQSEFGLAMRFSENFGAAIDIIEELWNVRWPIGNVHIERSSQGYRIALVRSIICSNENWSLATSIVALNFATVARAMLADRAKLVHYEFGGPPPSFAERFAALLDAQASWNHNYGSIFVPAELLSHASPLRNPESFASMIEVLRKRTQLQDEFDNLPNQVANLLAGINEGQIDAARTAKLLGLSQRTLERRLADANTSFRELSTAALRQRLEALLLIPGATAETMAQQMGYHDGSSLMRACRRIYGKSLSKVRQELKALHSSR